MLKMYNDWYGKTETEGFENIKEAQKCMNVIIEAMAVLKNKNDSLVLKVSMENRAKSQDKNGISYYPGIWVHNKSEYNEED